MSTRQIKKSVSKYFLFGVVTMKEFHKFYLG